MCLREDSNGFLFQFRFVLDDFWFCLWLDREERERDSLGFVSILVVGGVFGFDFGGGKGFRVRLGGGDGGV